jgi:hypothetical protein
MLSTVPGATENIYKFYVLLGLSLFISSGLGLVYDRAQHKELVTRQYLELETLRLKADLSPEEKKRAEVLEWKLNLDVADRRFTVGALGGVAGIGIVLIIVGFTIWQKTIQRKQDLLVDLQIEKLKQEIKALNK